MNISIGIAQNKQPVLEFNKIPLIGGNIEVLETATNIYIRSAFGDIGGTTYRHLYRYVKNVYACMFGFRSSVQLPVTSLDGVDIDIDNASGGDDNTPINVGVASGYVGANHGFSYIYKVTKTGHGLAYSDIGSHWTDANGTEFYLIAIGSTSVCYFAKKMTGTALSWTMPTSPAMSTTSLTRDGDIPFPSGYTQAQVALKSIRNATSNESLNGFTVSVLINSNVSATIGTTHTCKFVNVIEKYNICNLFTELAYIVNEYNSGRYFTANPTFAYTSPAFTITNVYRHEDYGVIKIFTKVECFVNSAWGYIGLMQKGMLAITTTAFTCTEVKSWIPKVNESVSTIINRTRKTHNITSTTNIVAASLIDANQLPLRFIEQGCGASDEKYHTIACGYLDYKDSSESAIKSASTIYWNFVTSHKAYPRIIDNKSTALVPGKMLEGACYRAMTWGQRYPNASAVYWINWDNYCLLYIDYHAFTGKETLTLPDIFAGKNYQVLESTTGDDAITVAGTLPVLTINVASAVHAYAIIKVL